MTTTRPTMDEVALGAFLEDIGKFMQRANGSIKAMAPEVRARESDVLPPDHHGGYTHKHALWTDAFFDWMAGENLAFPDGIDANRVRDAAVYHHHPRTPLHWLSAIADRLSAGMDRKAKDEAAEQQQAGDKAWDHFRKVPLKGLLDRINLGLDAPPGETTYPVTELTPETMFPAEVDTQRLPAGYADLWERFCEAFRALCTHAETVDQFHEGLLAISERFCWSIPSSTVDQPDISLHDHNRTVAAFAACLYRFHAAAGELDDETAIKNRDSLKFRVLTGDLSGIQSSLFRLRSEGVKGANRILRARSFLIGQVGEAAAWRCRQKFGLPPYCLLQSAGGRFQLLIPNLADAEARVDVLRGDFDTWMLERYTGDLVVNLALSPAFSGGDFHSARFAETLRRIAVSIDDAKQRPLATRLAGGGAVIRADYRDGPCDTCGLRPATVTDPDERDVKRCRTCAVEAKLGRDLPRAIAVTWHDDGNGVAALPGGLGLKVGPAAVDTAHDSGRRQRVVSGWRVRGNDEAGVFPVADRFVANHIPHLRPGDGDRGRYNDLSGEADEVNMGDAKLFEHLAADAREWLEPDGPFTGRAMLAVIKADVDRLGFVFAYGLGGDLSVGRAAQLSRMIDGFFTGYLDHRIRTRFPNTYTVYSGGDDLLLIAPWFDGIRLAQDLRREFGRFVNDNPNLTLSAGIEFIGVAEPLNRAVRRAEDKLDAAKHAGRDRVTVVTDTPIPWNGGDGSLDWALKRAEWLNEMIRADKIPTTFLHRMLTLDRQRRDCESGNNPAAANWRSRWAYHLARLRERQRGREADEIDRNLNELMNGKAFGNAPAAEGTKAACEPDPRIPITIALYRNR